jgi:hypothetical protein
MLLYEIMWEDTVQPDRPQITIKHGAENKLFPYRITKART